MAQDLKLVDTHMVCWYACVNAEQTSTLVKVLHIGVSMAYI
jgi:hypothetical protein